jgi:DNA-binding NarL/FixJ family response regulator
MPGHVALSSGLAGEGCLCAGASLSRVSAIFGSGACSTPCRTKAYRKRQAEAVRLHGEGHSLEDIARELDSDPDTVRGWIERKSSLSVSGRVEDG